MRVILHSPGFGEVAQVCVGRRGVGWAQEVGSSSGVKCVLKNHPQCSLIYQPSLLI